MPAATQEGPFQNFLGLSFLASIAITSASSLVYHGQTGRTAVGYGFGAVTGTLRLSDSSVYGAGTIVAQTVTAWTDTLITYTVVRGALALGTVYLWAIDSAGAHSAGFPVELTQKDPTGWTYFVNVVDGFGSTKFYACGHVEIVRSIPGGYTDERWLADTTGGAAPIYDRAIGKVSGAVIDLRTGNDCAPDYTPAGSRYILGGFAGGNNGFGHTVGAGNSPFTSGEYLDIVE